VAGEVVSASAWSSVAWLMWREQARSYEDVARELEQLGWFVSPAAIERECVGRAALELQRIFKRGIVTSPPAHAGDVREGHQARRHEPRR
jgi:hypothetical protein